MRAFITLEFDSDTKSRISDIQREIRKLSERGRFKYIDNFHITLKFLGEADEGTLGYIAEELLIKLREQGKFNLSIKGMSGFGIGKVVRTIYLGLTGETDVLHKIYDIIGSVCDKYGFESEGRFSPHVTIAQEVKLIGSFEELKEKVKVEGMDNICFDKVTIMKSEQISGKRIYTPIYVINLN